MSVNIQVLLDTAKAEADAQAFQEDLVRQFTKAAEAGEEGFKEFLGATGEDLRKLTEIAKREMDKQAKARQDAFEANERYAQKVADAARKAYEDQTKAAKEMADKTAKEFQDLVSDGIGVFGDLKDVFGLVAEGMLGLDKATAQTATKIFDLAEKGAMIGKEFGAVYGILGGVAGGLLGVSQEAIKFVDMAPEVIERTSLIKKAFDDARESFFNFQVTAASWLTQGTALRAEWFNQQEAIEKLGKNISDKLKDEKERREAVNIALVSQAKAQQALIKAMLEEVKLEQDVAKFRGKKRDVELSPSENLAALKKVKEVYDQQYKGRKDLTVAEKDAWQQAKNNYNDAKSSLQSFYGIAKDAKKEVKEIADEFTRSRTSASALRDITRGNVAGHGEALSPDEELQQAIDAGNERVRIGIHFNGLLMQEEYNLAKEKQALDAETRRLEKQNYEDRVSEIQGIFQHLSPVIDAVTGQIAENVEAGNKALDGMGKAARRGVASVLQSFAKQWTAKGIGEIAEGLASLAIGDFRGAAIHGGAAVEYFAAAAAAGYVGARQSRKGATGESGSRSGGQTVNTGGGLGRVANNNTGTQVQTPSIINIGLLAPGDRRQQQMVGVEVQKALSSLR